MSNYSKQWTWVKKIVQAGRSGYTQVSGMICDRRIDARVKGLVYKIAVRSAVMYNLKEMAQTKTHSVGSDRAGDVKFFIRSDPK